MISAKSGYVEEARSVKYLQNVVRRRRAERLEQRMDAEPRPEQSAFRRFESSPIHRAPWLEDRQQRGAACHGSSNLKVLHTSDWHLGQSLHGRKRYEEFKSFLDWLSAVMEAEGIDVLLIAGDVFDSSTPSNRAQELYYDFLLKASRTCCQNIVVIAGNHDSPSFLDAPKEILRSLNVYVIGQKAETAEGEVLVLHGEGSRPQAIVCAVPYLRDRDIRIVEPGESVEEKGAKLVAGIKEHYRDVCELAERKQLELSKEGHPKIPIVVMGHLFMVGGKTVSGGEIGELGSLTQVGADIFPASINYVALGHLHIPQRVDGAGHIRYCGSPIPLSFGEAKQEKTVIIAEFGDAPPNIHVMPIPCFQALESIVGSLDEITAGLSRLCEDGSDAWLEIEYTGAELVGNLWEIFHESIADSSMEIRRIKNRVFSARALAPIQDEEMLENLDFHQVFESCLDDSKIPPDERNGLLASYNEILQLLSEKDPRAD